MIVELLGIIHKNSIICVSLHGLSSIFKLRTATSPANMCWIWILMSSPLQCLWSPTGSHSKAVPCCKVAVRSLGLDGESKTHQQGIHSQWWWILPSKMRVDKVILYIRHRHWHVYNMFIIIYIYTHLDRDKSTSVSGTWKGENPIPIGPRLGTCFPYHQDWLWEWYGKCRGMGIECLGILGSRRSIYIYIRIHVHAKYLIYVCTVSVFCRYSIKYLEMGVFLST